MAEGDATSIRMLAVGLRTGEDVGDIRICAHTERGTPFFSDNFRETGDTCFGQTIIGLTSIAIDATGAANIDDVPRLPIFDSEIGRSGSHELERRSVVEGNDGVPLLVCHLPKACFQPCLLIHCRHWFYRDFPYLVYDSIPCKSSIIDDDMNLASSEICRPLYQLVDILRV